MKFRLLFLPLAALLLAASACAPNVPNDDTSSTSTIVPPTTVTTTSTTVPVTHAPFSRPLVSFEFDDGLPSSLLGQSILKEYGYNATNYVLSDPLSRPDYYSGYYMTPAEVKTWVARGGEIGSHTVDHLDLTTLSPSQIHAEMNDSKLAISKLLGATPTLLATPYCGYNDTVIAIAKLYYQGMRNCDDPTNIKANWDPYNIHSVSIDTAHTVDEIKTELAKAKSAKGWMVIVLHEIDESGGQYATSPTKLRQIAQAVKDSGITVVSSRQAFEETTGIVGGSGGIG